MCKRNDVSKAYPRVQIGLCDADSRIGSPKQRLGPDERIERLVLEERPPLGAGTGMVARTRNSHAARSPAPFAGAHSLRSFASRWWGYEILIWGFAPKILL